MAEQRQRSFPPEARPDDTIEPNRPFLEALPSGDYRAGVVLERSDGRMVRAYGRALLDCSQPKQVPDDDIHYRVMRQDILDQPQLMKLFADCRPDDLAEYRQALIQARRQLAPEAPEAANDKQWWRRRSVQIGGLAALVLAAGWTSHGLAEQPQASQPPAVHHPAATSQPTTQPSPTQETPTQAPTPTPSPAATAPAPAPAAPSPTSPPEATPFTLSAASLNSLGARHTDRKHGNAHGEMPPSWIRAPKEAELIEKTGVDVIGLQEFQRPQRSIVLKKIGNKYAIYPTQADYPTSVNSIMWKKDKFKLVGAGTTTTHYFGGQAAKMPWVRLQPLVDGKPTGEVVEIHNFHDPANTKSHPDQNKWRTEDAILHRQEAEQLKEKNVAGIFTCDCNSGIGSHNRQRHLDQIGILLKGNLVEDAIRGANRDHVFYLPGKITADGSKKVPTPGISDHQMVVANLTLDQ